ncbi:hypothetical protein J2D69_10630 [Lysinibacillus sphaericus]|uniref:Uncharacterized protein n=4 Tax=Lysinibacillus TaxID=400634 RepID=B1HYK0_LYSSC|nr:MULTISPECIES: hypothetical protein [Lysinibacillus]ACA40161.1 conserved hypothetical protein [Lysinibacillus sphaericus C3-41]AMO33778.1 hypothetical protein AR327_15740 [Lysinibacillus sphaericus]AMR91113.1 hypothetical protein A1T07_13470 [Lysinibacillus sphaericus]ANA45162.1 hypothetical protein A2J09_06135 [Lysinibacillus sphaericus]EWH32202.1 membrane protein [Lysinibacillus sphaericus CBAM5]
MRKYDTPLAIFFALCSTSLLIAFIFNHDLLDWAFARHHNQFSWYIRPIFIIPFCFFAFKRSLAGISFTLFCIFTSMFWFPEPTTVDTIVQEFLQYEVDYLTGDWELGKILLTLMVPLSLTLLALAFWQRNIWFGFSIMAFIAIGKVGWSILFVGNSGKSIIIPATFGLIVCMVFVYLGITRSKRR